MRQNQEITENSSNRPKPGDRRASIRHKVNIRMRLRPTSNSAENTSVDVYPLNLSESGLCIVTETKLSPLKKYEIELLPENRNPIIIKTRIQWMRSEAGKVTYGLYVEHLDPDQQDTIFACLRDYIDVNSSISTNDRRIKNRRESFSPAFPDNGGFRKIERRAGTRQIMHTGLSARFLTEQVRHLLYRRVVVTGLGLKTPLGNDRETFCNNLRKGESGIRYLDRFEGHPFPCMLGGQLHNFDPNKSISSKRARQMDFSTQMIVAAGIDAIRDARLKIESENRRRVGVATGTIVGGLGWAFEQHDQFNQSGMKNMHPYTVAAASPNATSSELAAEVRTQGPCVTFSQGCTSSSSALTYAYEQLRMGNADLMLAGGVEAPFIPSLYASFCKSGILSRTSGKERHIPAPFSKHKRGTILAEGAAILVLEDLAHALARNAHIYAEVTGCSSNCDGYDMLRPKRDGIEASLAMEMAISNAGISPNEIDIVFTHAPGFGDADFVEIKALRRAFGKALGKINIANIKSMTGYLQGATGAMDCVSACLSIENSFIPPFISEHSFETILNTSAKMRSFEVEKALINCFGFGGKNVCLVLAKYHE